MTYTDLAGTRHTIDQHELDLIAQECGHGRQSYLEYARERWRAPLQVPAAPLMAVRPGAVPIGSRPAEGPIKMVPIATKRVRGYPVTDLEHAFIMRHPEVRHVTLGHILRRTADTIRERRRIGGVTYTPNWRFGEQPAHVKAAQDDWYEVLASISRRSASGE